MIAVDLNAPDGSAVHVPLGNGTSAVTHTATNQLVVFFKDTNGVITTQNFPGQQGIDLKKFITAVQAMTLTTTS